MTDIGTQTEDFIILSMEQIKKMSIPDRKIYKKELKEYKHEQSLQKTRNYQRKYHQNYNKMRYKYDPKFRMKSLESTKRYLENRKIKKHMEKEIRNNSDVLERIKNVSTDAETSNIIDSFNLLFI